MPHEFLDCPHLTADIFRIRRQPLIEIASITMLQSRYSGEACALHNVKTRALSVGFMAPGMRSLQDGQCLGKWVFMIAADLLSSKHAAASSDLSDCNWPVSHQCDVASNVAILSMLPAGILREAITGVMVGMKLEAMTEAMTGVMTGVTTGAARHLQQVTVPPLSLAF